MTAAAGFGAAAVAGDLKGGGGGHGGQRARLGLGRAEGVGRESRGERERRSTAQGGLLIPGQGAGQGTRRRHGGSARPVATVRERRRGEADRGAPCQIFKLFHFLFLFLPF